MREATLPIKVLYFLEHFRFQGRLLLAFLEDIFTRDIIINNSNEGEMFAPELLA